MKEKLVAILGNYGFYLWPALVLVTIVYLLVNIDLPKIREIQATRQELTGIQERLANLSAKSNLLASLNVSKLKEDQQKIDLVLPDGKDAPSILRNLEASATVSGVTINDFDLVPGKIAVATVSGEKSNEIPIKIEVSGTMPQIINFLEKITNIGRAMGLRNLEIELKEDSTSDKTRVEFVAYFLAPSEALAKVGNVDEPLSVWGPQENETLVKIYQRELLPPSSIVAPAGKPDLFK